eukprot:CAMPEP_0198346298 /NCGR_PEP_ID=MMETSP1450-20131203/78806_1 /TAXON_ID=753684 ORGANISM="Madagascaria erythrocladiodes, Strain CCMP3234" /NCGR_SAMPLE_ID=MMETSP1450 /ASSEMBLY_ACC=CAM_ASM_001115 /LENGTH=138 /DNA_ID=CAMNT_0044051711 /DNA_START=213 /DNA_END=626 /DNA_ORIENTATION=+
MKAAAQRRQQQPQGSQRQPQRCGNSKQYSGQAQTTMIDKLVAARMTRGVAPLTYYYVVGAASKAPPTTTSRANYQITARLQLNNSTTFRTRLSSTSQQLARGVVDIVYTCCHCRATRLQRRCVLLLMNKTEGITTSST